MPDLRFLPLRQKWLLGFTIGAGICIMISAVFALPEHGVFNTIIFLYSIAIPLSLLCYDTIIDLNNKKVFRCWLCFALVIFLISLTGYDNDIFLIRHSIKNTTVKHGISNWIIDHSVSSLKAPLVFLVVYWLLNTWANKKDKYLVNTFRNAGWYHNGAGREITGGDMIANVILYLSVVASALFGH